MGYAISLGNGEAAIKVAASKRTASIARNVAQLLDMADTPENIRWIKANLEPVEAVYREEEEFGEAVDFGYYSKVPVVAVV